MTYNIRYAADQPEIYSWKNRRDGIQQNFQGIDIAGLQEVLLVQAEDLNSSLPGYRMITESGLKDTYREIRPDPDSLDITFHGCQNEIGLTRIDFIFVTPDFKVKNTKVIRKK
jgi:endonuclease/exonuclease/phosphatase family metal-dependent hydrolase